MRLALGKTTGPRTRVCEACVSAIKEISDGDGAQAPIAASEFARGHRPKRRLDTEEEAEDRPLRPATAGVLPLVTGGALSAQPE